MIRVGCKERHLESAQLVKNMHDRGVLLIFLQRRCVQAHVVDHLRHARLAGILLEIIVIVQVVYGLSAYAEASPHDTIMHCAIEAMQKRQK